MNRLYKILGYQFKNKSILNTALTHPSMKNEGVPNNQRLEFLGDAVLGMVVAEHLYSHDNLMQEGKLTKMRSDIVCEVTLADVAESMGLGDFIILAKGEEVTGGRHRSSNLADLFEALVAAIYLDGGYSKAKEFILTKLSQKIELAKSDKLITDYKTKLQELLQVGKSVEILYTLNSRTGPEHSSFFDVSVFVNGEKLGTGNGRSKKQAEQNAAKIALEKLEE